MDQTSDYIDRFKQELSRTRSPIDTEGLLRGWLAKAGRWAVEATNVSGHPFPEQVKDLRSEVQQAKMPDVVLILPKPGSSVRFCQFWWRYQLLLFAAASQEKNRSSLVDLLDTSEQGIGRCFSEAEARLQQDWSFLQWASRLGDAIEVLRFDAGDALPLTFDGKYVHYGDKRVRLSEQEAVLFRLLHDAYPDDVPFTSIEQGGVARPIQRKSNLVKKLNDNRAPVTVINKQQSYSLHIK